METLRCRQKQDEVTSGASIVAPSGQKGFFYFDRVKPTRFLEKLQRDSWKGNLRPLQDVSSSCATAALEILLQVFKFSRCIRLVYNSIH